VEDAEPGAGIARRGEVREAGHNGAVQLLAVGQVPPHVPATRIQNQAREVHGSPPSGGGGVAIQTVRTARVLKRRSAKEIGTSMRMSAASSPSASSTRRSL